MTDVNFKRIKDTEANAKANLADKKMQILSDGDNTVVFADGSNIGYLLKYGTWNGSTFSLEETGSKIDTNTTTTGLNNSLLNSALFELNDEKLSKDGGEASSGSGASITWEGQDAATGGGGDGGDLIIRSGAGDGAGTDGTVLIDSILEVNSITSATTDGDLGISANGTGSVNINSATTFSNGVAMQSSLAVDTITANSANTDLTLSGFGTGVVKVSDEIHSDVIVSPSPPVPSSASDTGTAGTISWDSDYIYICVATDTWKRVGVSTW